MDKIIGPWQRTFLLNRKAADNTIIVQDIITKFRKMKGKEGNVIMKIDLEKAFDKIEWSFIRNTLPYFNFRSNLINLIMFCICTSSVAILVNGTWTDFFSPTKGIRQEDPMSPYIFILCMEVLSHNINQALCDRL